MANSTRFIFPIITLMPTTNHESSWINEQYCGLAKISDLVSWCSKLVSKVLIVINFKSVSESVGQACWYADRLFLLLLFLFFFPVLYLRSFIYKAFGVVD